MLKIWDVIYPLVFFFLCLVISTIVVLIIFGAVYGGLPIEVMLRQFPVTAILVNIIFYGVTILTQFRVYKRDGLRFGERKLRWKWFIIVLSLIGAAVLSLILNVLIMNSPLPEMFSGYDDASSITFEGQNPILVILSTVILAPIAEELIFRGLMYDRMKRYLGIPASVILTSLAFGVYHGTVIQFIYASAIGVMFALYYEKSGSLIMPIAAHAVMNALAVTSFF